MVATWIPMLTVHQVMTANVTPVTKLVQMVPTPTHVIKDPSVLISMNALLEHNLSMLDDVEENGYQCVCSAGYAAPATDPETNIVTECCDIDECADETNNCDASATCSNNSGGYDYSQSGLGHIGGSHNIDECLVPSHNCDENATCTSNNGGFTCACNAGWNTGGNGQAGSCYNVNECSETVNSHT